jgi:hypothetical protein
VLQRNVEMLSGGYAEWERQVPIGNGTRAVGYRANLMTRLTTEDHSAYLRTIFIGMDKVLPDEEAEWGDDSGGYGNFHMEDIHTGESLLGRIEWRVEAGQDFGTFFFEDGDGYWKGISGALPQVRLDWCTRDPEASIAAGVPVTLLAFIEAHGPLNFAD